MVNAQVHTLDRERLAVNFEDDKCVKARRSFVIPNGDTANLTTIKIEQRNFGSDFHGSPHVLCA